MSRTQKSNARIKAEIMLRDYDQHCRRLAEIDAEIIHATPTRPEVPITGSGQTSDSTAATAHRLMTDVERRRIKEEVAAVQYAYGMCKSAVNGDKIRKIIDLVYRRGTHTMLGASLQIGLSSEKWAGKLATKFFQWIDDWFTL